MTASKKNILKEISLWKKRIASSKQNLNSVYKNVSKDAKKLYKEAIK